MLSIMELPSSWSRAANTASRIVAVFELRPLGPALPPVEKLDNEIEEIKPRDRHPPFVRSPQGNRTNPSL
jgi:hypothetical protein